VVIGSPVLTASNTTRVVTTSRTGIAYARHPYTEANFPSFDCFLARRSGRGLRGRCGSLRAVGSHCARRGWCEPRPPCRASSTSASAHARPPRCGPPRSVTPPESHRRTRTPIAAPMFVCSNNVPSMTTGKTDRSVGVPALLTATEPTAIPTARAMAGIVAFRSALRTSPT
jgi:hypothetical protein